MASIPQSDTSYSFQKHKLYKQHVLVMFEDEDLSDVCFRVGNEQSGIKDIHGIRALFAGHSNVLKSMLFGNMLESQINNIIEIKDVSPNAFDWFKKFCYGLNPSITSNNICGILHICDKYCMNKLMNISLNEYLIDIMPNDSMKSLITVLVELNQKNMDNVVCSILHSDQFDNFTNLQLSSMSDEILTFSIDDGDEIAFVEPKLAINILFYSKMQFMKRFEQKTIFLFIENYCKLLAKSQYNVRMAPKESIDDDGNRKLTNEVDKVVCKDKNSSSDNYNVNNAD